MVIITASLKLLTYKQAKKIPKNKNKLRKNLNKCQPSVVKTKIVVDPTNLGPKSGLPKVYLFCQDSLGFQKIGFKLLNIDR